MLRKRNNKHKKNNNNTYLNKNIARLTNNIDKNLFINSYNNFLSTLDKKSIINKDLNKKNNVKLNELLKNIEDNYDKHFNKSKLYVNLNNNYNENLKSNNPNLYINISDIQTRKNLNYSKIYKYNLPTPYIPKNIIYNNEVYTPKIKKNIDIEINNLNDLIKLINENKIEPNVEYNINMKSLHDIKDHLIELDNMIGMKDLKNNIVEQILYFSQNLHISHDNNDLGDFMHTVIYGPPGTGKTEIAKIMGKIYSKIGILSSGVFKKVTRSDLIAGYLGQTALKTKEVIKECLGGVLFIDEAYSLGNYEKRDSFSKECIDTLCEALSDHKNNLMVIIAGYEDELKECFFDYNQGLDSRFTWRFKTDEYKSEELFKILLKKIKDIGWNIDYNCNLDHKWLDNKMDYFKFYGRDIETLLAKTKIAHSKRVFCKPESFKKKINIEDLNLGFEKYINNNEVKKRKEKQILNKMLYSMYI